MSKRSTAIPIWRHWVFKLVEDGDASTNPEVGAVVELPAAQLGDGRCQCGRKLPAIRVNARLDRSELVDMARAVLAWDEYVRANAINRARLDARIAAHRTELEERERAALERERLRKLGTPGNPGTPGA